MTEITRYNIDYYCCSICGANLVQPFDGHQVVIRCAKDPKHKGVMKKEDSTIKTLRQCGEAGELAIEQIYQRNGVKKTMSEVAGDTNTKLAKYENKTGLQLTKDDVTEIITTLWPTAPENEKKKAMLLCYQYRLNPLAKHVYLIPFDHYENQGGKRVKTGTDWSMVWGIEATRLVARRAALKAGIRYGYNDFTPRIMTEAEQMKINGKIDNDNIWAITILCDQSGMTLSVGTGFWPRYKVYNNNRTDNLPKGTEKGNTPENMAKIRSERQALNRLFPGSMAGMDEGEVVDEAYVEPARVVEEVIEGEATVLLDEATMVDESTGEILASRTPIPAPEHVSSKAEVMEKLSQVPDGKLQHQIADLKAMTFSNIGEMVKYCSDNGFDTAVVLKAVSKKDVKTLDPIMDWPVIVDKLFAPRLKVGA